MIDGRCMMYDFEYSVLVVDGDGDGDGEGDGDGDGDVARREEFEFDCCRLCRDWFEGIVRTEGLKAVANTCGRCLRSLGASLFVLEYSVCQ